MWGFLFFVFILLWIAYYSRRFANHEKIINEKIRSIGGETLKIEKIAQLSGTWFLIFKRSVYRIEYRHGDEDAEGWVKFKTITGPEWKL